MYLRIYFSGDIHLSELFKRRLFIERIILSGDCYLAELFKRGLLIS